MIKHLAKFILAILIFILVILNTLSLTILSDKGIKDFFEKNNYYEEIHEKINSVYEDNLVQSELDIETITSAIDDDMVRNGIDSVIDSLLNGTKINLKLDDLRVKLDEKIDSLVEDVKLSNEDKKSLERLKDTLVSIYADQIAVSSDIVDEISPYITIAKKAVEITETVILVIMAIVVLVEVFLKKTTKTIGDVLLAAGVISIALKYLIGSQYMNILIINELFSKIAVNLVTYFLDGVKYRGVLIAIIGLILIIVDVLLNESKKKDIPKLRK